MDAMDKGNDMPTDDSADPVLENDALPQLYGSAQEVVSRHTHCAICGANLHFSHLTDFVKNLTQETARCPECGIKARQSVHRLQ